MSRKHHAQHSDVMGAAAAATPAKRRAARDQRPISPSSALDQKFPSASPAQREIDREAVAKLAYKYWLARGCTGGSAEHDWLRAEQELRANKAAVALA